METKAFRQKVTASDLANKELVIAACTLAEKRHNGQRRKSGELFIEHPLAVGDLLLDIGQSAEVVAAGVLHDVPEDTKTTLQEIEKQFGQTVALLVNGVTQQIEPGTDEVTRKRVYYFKLIAMVQTDWRIMLIRLADRLHNMRTLRSLSKAAQKRIARETLEVYIPMAYLLKNWFVDFDFQTIYPWLGELQHLSHQYLDGTGLDGLVDLVTNGCQIEQDRLKQEVGGQ